MGGTIVLLSGGLDSSTLLASLLDKKYNVVKTISFVYGSSHNRHELTAAAAVSGHYGIEREVMNLESLFRHFKSALLGSTPIPDGHYQEENMRQTVVPGRNSIFLSVAAGYAESIGASKVAIAAHAGDHFIYPDCRPSFLTMMAAAVRLGSDEKVRLVSPFQEMTKHQILIEGMRLGVPYQLTRTCYKDQPRACGRCGSCQERLEAFAMIGEEDPLDYDSRELLPKTT